MSAWTGAEQLVKAGFSRLRGQRIGLLTNPTGVTNDLTPLVELLARSPDVDLRAVFSPEHGLTAAAQAGTAVENLTHLRYGVPVYSLYGAARAPSAAQLSGLELLVVDLADAGARFFTYISTIALALEACAANAVPVLLLDRPNPLNGVTIEGPPLDPAFHSFVGWLPVPVRHGLTVGELARLANSTLGPGADLTVLPLEGWRREHWFDETGLSWVPPSPNLPTLASATVYPGTCLLEGTNVSEGRGTTQPFELCGAPWIAGYDLAAALNDLALPGVRWRAVTYKPCGGRVHAGAICEGVQLHVTNRAAFQPVATGLWLLATIQRLYPEHFAWRAPDEPGKPPPIDLLSGGARVREALDAGVPVDELVDSWGESVREFAAARRPYVLCQ